jgi:hypothetical protein
MSTGVGVVQFTERHQNQRQSFGTQVTTTITDSRNLFGQPPPGVFCTDDFKNGVKADSDSVVVGLLTDECALEMRRSAR